MSSPLLTKQFVKRGPPHHVWPVWSPIRFSPPTCCCSPFKCNCSISFSVNFSSLGFWENWNCDGAITCFYSAAILIHPSSGLIYFNHVLDSNRLKWGHCRLISWVTFTAPHVTLEKKLLIRVYLWMYVTAVIWLLDYCHSWCFHLGHFLLSLSRYRQWSAATQKYVLNRWF